MEGIIPALETSHAVAYTFKLAKEMKKNQNIVINLSGRGDKDLNTVAKLEGIKIWAESLKNFSISKRVKKLA